MLRPWRPSDVDAVVEAFADAEIQYWHMRRFDPDEAVAWIEEWTSRWTAETDASWAIVEADADEAAGYLGLRGVSLPSGYGQISYWVRPSFCRRGLATAATAATAAAAAWSFDDLGLHRVEIRHSVRNLPSCGVAQRSGFAYEGTAVEALLHSDGWHDMHVHARIADRDAPMRRAGRPPTSFPPDDTMTSPKEEAP
ncbi:MAG: GNAT family N-acetyltransferase [Actinomycetota bacterium]